MSQNKSKSKPNNPPSKKTTNNSNSQAQKDPSNKSQCQYCKAEISSKEKLCSRCRYNNSYEDEDYEKNPKKKSISVSHASSSNHAAALEKHAKEVSSNHFNSKDSFTELSKARIPLKNLVYVIGLAPEISKEEILNSYEYFGQYGKINKLVVNRNMPYNPNNQKGPSYSAYITYSNEREASLAIYAIDEIPICNRILRASYGTTKYCINFLKNQDCPNSECFYLHAFIKNEPSYDKDQISNNKNIFADQQKLALAYLKKCYTEVLKIKPKNVETKLPNISEIINKLKEIKNDEKNKNSQESEEEKISSTKKEEDERIKPKTSKNNIVATAASSRTNKNKQAQPHKEKILDIISLDEPNLEKNEKSEKNKNEKSQTNEKNKSTERSSKEEEKHEMKSKKQTKLEKRKKMNNEDLDKDETNSLPEKQNDYYDIDENKNYDGENKNNFYPNLEIKASRKAESMYVEVCDIDKEIIKLFLSDKYGKNENSRFSFANSNTNSEIKKMEDSTKTDMRKSMQEFLKFSLSPSFSPEEQPNKIQSNGILFEKFITTTSNLEDKNNDLDDNEEIIKNKDKKSDTNSEQNIKTVNNA